AAARPHAGPPLVPGLPAAGAGAAAAAGAPATVGTRKAGGMTTNAILRAGYAVPLAKDRLAYRDPSAAILAGISEQEMSVPAVISTVAEDRDGDVVVPGGIDVSEYRDNPIVLWSHGQAADIPFAIGKALAP